MREPHNIATMSAYILYKIGRGAVVTIINLGNFATSVLAISALMFFLWQVLHLLGLVPACPLLSALSH